MKLLKIFVVEDNKLYAKGVEHHLQLNPDNEVSVYPTGRACLDQLYKEPDLIFLDYSLPDLSGIEVLRAIQNSKLSPPVVIVSGQEDVSTAVKLLKEGAYDYIVKDENARERMWNAANNIRENAKLRTELEQLREELNTKYDFSNIKGRSEVLQKVFKLIEKAARTKITVSITGETGTGKELVAKAIHYNSSKRERPMVAVNMTAIPRELMESELFGHEKGAFTGAQARRVGKFEEAHESTLFLDEIADLDLSLQAKLLRVLQEKEVTRLGSNRPVPAAPRIIVATHKNLAEEVKQGRFREDLYYRLLGLPIELPPLRERGDDILLLAQHFLEAFAEENQLKGLKLSQEAREKLRHYRWPGNVRELKAVMELSAVLCSGDQIEASDISFPASGDDWSDLWAENLTLRDYTRKIIQHYLDRHDHNVVRVAEKLDVGKSTIYRMIKNKELTLKSN
jgi:DNA-binding NtrC family response regulator